MPPDTTPPTGTEFDKAETTQERVKLAVHQEVLGPLEHFKRVQVWVVVVLTVAGSGFTAASYLSRYATAAEVEKVADANRETARALSTHVQTAAEKMGALEAQGRNIESDYHWQREQLQRIADRVGAQRVPAPSHEPEPPAERPHR